MSHPFFEFARSAILIDQLPFRRAGLLNILAPWAQEEGFSLRQSDGAAIDEEACEGVSLVLLSVGGEGLSNPCVAQVVSAARARFGEAPIALFSDSCEGPHIRAACESGVDAYIPTNLEPTTALKALSFVVAGGKFFPPESLFETASPSIDRGLPDGGMRLTQRQNDIIEGLQLGQSNKMIARKLNIAEATVKIHIRQIMRKLGVNNRTQIALLAVARREAPLAPAQAALVGRVVSDQVA
jgi:DNA-binding NarL/FixJ family response regulator